MLHRDVKEIAATASRIKDGDFAKPVMEGVDSGAGFLEVAFAGEGESGGANIFPFSAERFDDRR
jgi:hypothetical protein